MKKRNAFTLLELLAVIIVLAIISLIATPIVINVVKSAKKSSAIESVTNYVRAVDMAISMSKIDKNRIPNGEYQINSDGNLCLNDDCSKVLEIETKGNRPTNGKLIVSNGEVDSNSIVMMNDYTISYNPTSEKYEVLKINFNNGQEVYFDVSTGKKCSNYQSNNSRSEYDGINQTASNQNSCLKFYAFNDTEDNTINLFLDHSIKDSVMWNPSGNNQTGPTTVLETLNSATSSWKGTEEPKNYSLDQSNQASKSKYTIDYSGYKARLISAEEIAQIVGNDKFDVKTAIVRFYYEDYTDNYSWLAHTWTSSALASGDIGAWVVNDIYLGGDRVEASHAIRPVITVLKFKLI